MLLVRAAPIAAEPDSVTAGVGTEDTTMSTFVS